MASEHTQSLLESAWPESAGQGQTTNLSPSTTPGEQKGGCQHLPWYIIGYKKAYGLRILPKEGEAEVWSMCIHSSAGLRILAELTAVCLLKSVSKD